MTGIVKHISSDRLGIYIELSGQWPGRMDDKVGISRQRAKRTLDQNRFYWSFLQWIICPNGGNLREQGHFSPDALHADFKAWYKETYQHEVNIDFTTTELNTAEMTEYMERITVELCGPFFNIDVGPFYRDYEEFKDWVLYFPYGSFKEFMDTKK